MLLFSAVAPVPSVRVTLWCSGGGDLSLSSWCSWSCWAQWEAQRHRAPAVAPTWEPCPPPLPAHGRPWQHQGQIRSATHVSRSTSTKNKTITWKHFPPTCTHCKYMMKNITQRTTLTSSFSQMPAPVWAGDALTANSCAGEKHTPIWKLQIHTKRRNFDAGRQKL